MDAYQQNVFLSQEGIVAAANLFSLIVESELKGNSTFLHVMPLDLLVIQVFRSCNVGFFSGFFNCFW